MELDHLREEINRVDDELVQAFQKRMEVALKIAEFKRERSLPVLDAQREREVVSRMASACNPQLSMYVKILYNTLFDISRSYQHQQLIKPTALSNRILKAKEETPRLFPKEAAVACQGGEGAYSQHAMDKLFSLPNVMYCKRFEGVFQAIESGLCRYGVLPIENSSHGSVTEVYDLMRKYRFSIVRSTRLKIDHQLLGKPGVNPTQLKEIISHEQAFGQCGRFLRGLPDVKLTVAENTALAAERVAESDRTDVAAIASRDCAALYGLRVLQPDISDSDCNFTRFICIAKELEIFPGADKMSLMMNVQHKPGALYAMIGKFAALGLNLTKLESRPIPGTDFEFTFYFDLDASVYDPAALQIISEMDEGSEGFTFLGCYHEI